MPFLYRTAPYILGVVVSDRYTANDFQQLICVVLHQTTRYFRKSCQTVILTFSCIYVNDVNLHTLLALQRKTNASFQRRLNTRNDTFKLEHCTRHL